jgi:hypothetical protein
MKTSLLCIVILSAVALNSTVGAEEDVALPILRLEVDLIDGSRVIGTPRMESVSVETSYAKMDVPLKDVLVIGVAADHETASLELRNGDKLKGVIDLKGLKLETLFGKVSIGMEQVKEVRFMLFDGALSEALSKGLVLHYAFDRDEGGKVADRSGMRNDGTIHGGVAWTDAGISGGACRFDGAESYIDTGNPSLANGFTEVTLSAWVRPSSTTPHSGILCLYAPGNLYEVLALSEGAPGKNDAMVYVGNGTAYTAAMMTPVGFLSTPEWHLLTGTWKSPLVGGDGLVRAYMDGALCSASETSRFLGGTVAQHFPLLVGWDAVGATRGESRHFNGLLDDVRVYNRSLSDDEVRQLFSVMH